MARRSGLGRGLGALIPGEHVEGDSLGAELRELPIESIRPNRFQPRTQFDDEALDSLAASIAEVGVLQPILVRPVPTREGEYELVAGERRWRSARRAGLPTVPALIQRDASDLHSLEVALIENLHRADLNPLEEAAAYQQLIDEFDLTHDQVAEAVSRSRPAITNALRLLGLPISIQALVANGELSAGHARCLLPLEDPEEMEAFASKFVADGLSVRVAEDLVRRHLAAPPPPAPTAAEPNAEAPVPRDLATTHEAAGIAELEHLLSERLETRVRVQLKAKGGKVLVDFADLDDLERIYRTVTGLSSRPG